MKLGLINSAFYQAGVDTVTGLNHISRIGFDCVDIATEAVGISKKEIRRVARATVKVSVLNSVDAMVHFVDECDHSRVRANIDISHLVLSDIGPDEIKKLKGKAIHVHLSDCDGKVHGDLPPGRGVVKFGPYLQAIKELKIDGVVSIELEYSPDPTRIVEWVEEAYRETAKLMDLVGLRG